MKVLKSIFVSLLFIFCLSIFSQLRIEITGGAEDPINIAIVPIEWNLEIPQLENYLNVLYPKHQVQELWGCTYRQGEFAQTHNHSGFDFSFVWFVDTCSHCSPLVFPDPEHPWMPPLEVHKPKKGNLVVFDAHDIHYVPPQSCNHNRITVSGNMSLNNEGEYDNRQPWD